jgi:hypothetical protein
MIHAPEINAWSLLYERSNEDSLLSYRDVVLSGLACTVAGDTVTVAQSLFGGHVPAANDLVVRGTQLLVTGVATSGSDYVLTLEGAPVSGATLAWHQGYACVVEWQAQHLPGLGSRWTEAHAEFQTIVGIRQDATASLGVPVKIGGTTERSAAASTVTADVVADTIANFEAIVRVGLPRDVVRGSRLYPRVSVHCASAWWLLTGLTLHFLPQSQRVAR